MAGRRVGLSGSTVGLVVGSDIAKAIVIGEESGVEVKEELGAVAGACIEIVAGALWGSVI